MLFGSRHQVELMALTQLTLVMLARSLQVAQSGEIYPQYLSLLGQRLAVRRIGKYVSINYQLLEFGQACVADRSAHDSCLIHID